jgi:hypothetical protein
MITKLDGARASRARTVVDFPALKPQPERSGAEQAESGQAPRKPTVGDAIREHERQLVLAALATYYSDRIYTDFGGNGTDPGLLLQIGKGPLSPADPESVLQLSTLLARAAEEASERSKAILSMSVPEHVLNPDFADDSSEPSEIRVVKNPARKPPDPKPNTQRK